MPRGRKRQFDRQEVLERAAGLFWEQGYETTGITEFGGVFGIGRQSLYNTYGNKRSLYLEAQRLGELPKEASPADLARSLLVMSQGLLLLNQNQRLRDSGVGEAVLRTATAMLRPS